MTHRILLVVPTLGTRHDLLQACLRSIRSQSAPAEVVIVSPPSPAIRAIADSVNARWVEDPKEGLAAAINAACATAGAFDYLSWLGDDDLTADSLAHTSHALDESPTPSWLGHASTSTQQERAYGPIPPHGGSFPFSRGDHSSCHNQGCLFGQPPGTR